MRIVLILLLLRGHLSAQTPRFFRHFTEKDGLSSDNVTCILREPQGYLWVGTNYGLNRYDGRQFKQYLPNSSQPDQTICHEFISALDLDDDGNLWIATRKGLNRYDPRTRRFQTWINTGRDNNSLPNDLVNNLLADGKRIWVACDNRDLAYLDLNTGEFVRLPWKKFTDTALPASVGRDYKTIYTIQKKSEQALWLHTNLGLMTYDQQTGQFALCAARPQAVAPFQRTDLDCAEHVLTGSWDDDVLCYDPCRGHWSQVRLPLRSNMHDGFRRVAQVAPDGARNWVLSQQGLYFFDVEIGKIQPIAREKGNVNHVPEGAMQAYHRDVEGLRWFGGERGLWQLDPQLQWFEYMALDTTPFASFSNRYARIVDVFTLKRRFISDLYRGQLLVLDDGRWVKTLQIGVPSAVLKQDKTGRIWVSGGLNLYELDPKTLRLTPFPIKKDFFDVEMSALLTDFEVDWTGDYWLATNNSGLLRYQTASGIWEKFGPEHEFIARNINCVFADSVRQCVWVGTEDYGLFRFDPKSRRFTLYQPDKANPAQSLGAYMIRDIERGPKGDLWLATDPGGISRFDYAAPPASAFSNINTTAGLPSNQVCSVVADRAGRLWAGTTKGLVCMGQDAAMPIFWNKNSGLHNEYLDLPLNLGADGKIYMGGTQGMTNFHPDSLLQQELSQAVQLNSFKVFDRELIGTFDNAIVLPWNDNFFSVEFVSSAFSTPERTQYAAQLVGFEGVPQPLGQQPYRAFTNVPPGEYILLLMASRNNSATGILRLKIVILPPYWQTWWFRLLAACCLAGLIWSVYQYRIGQIRKQEALKTAFNRRLAQVEMSALRAQMNPHFVFNCLNSINRFILVNEPDAASEYLTKFSRLIRLILDNSRSETVPLDKELEALRLYIEMEAMRFEGRFAYSIEVDPALQPEHLEVPPLLIQPFVENAIWHGLMHQKERGLLRIVVGGTDPISTLQKHSERANTSGLHIQIEDNGVGRAKAQELKSKSAQTHKSQGLDLTSERLDMIRSLYGVETDIQIVDLFTDEGAAAGTRVHIRIA
jgi:ligand-binding sensor domain-containing protein